MGIDWLGGNMNKVKACLFTTLFSIQIDKLNLCYFPAIIISRYKNAHFFSSQVVVGKRVQEAPTCAADVLRYFGCSETHLHMIFTRNPSLRNAVAAKLESKLKLLTTLGIDSSDLVKIIHCRPRFLSCGVNKNNFDQRLGDLMSLFESRDLLIKAIVRNPSFLIYDYHKEIKPVFSLYEEMGLCRKDVISMLLLRPTLVPRTKMTREKVDYIRRTGVSIGSKMYKYVVTILGVSRFETICEKVSNLEKFGFSEDEVLKFFGRNPLLFTLSVDKVQRSMTFVMGTMKLPAKTVCDHPILLFCSLEVVLRPRVLLAAKIREMGLSPNMDGPVIFSALRMSEKRFIKVFVECHEEEVSNELLHYYTASKGIKRLAESSKKTSYTFGFPF